MLICSTGRVVPKDDVLDKCVRLAGPNCKRAPGPQQRATTIVDVPFRHGTALRANVVMLYALSPPPGYVATAILH